MLAEVNEAFGQGLHHRGLTSPCKSPRPHQSLSTALIEAQNLGHEDMAQQKKTLPGAHRQQLEIFTAKFWRRNSSAKAIAGPRIERQDAEQVRVAVLDKVPRAGWAGGRAAGSGQPTAWVNEEAQGLRDCMSTGT